MTEWEMERICERNPDCGCKCYKCPVMAQYQRSQLGLDEDYDEDGEY